MIVQANCLGDIKVNVGLATVHVQGWFKSLESRCTGLTEGNDECAC